MSAATSMRLQARGQLLRVFLLGAGAFSLSTLFSSAKPVLLARFIEQLGISQSAAGLLVAAPFIGIACASLCVNWLLSRLSTLPAITVFGLLLLGGQLINTWHFDQFWWVLVCQLAGGVSVGVLMGYSARDITQLSCANQLFGLVDMVAVLLMSAMIAGISGAVSSSGLAGGFFISSAIVTVFLLIMLVGCPKPAQDDQTTIVEPFVIRPRPVLLIAAGVLFVTFSGMGFAFMFGQARELGLSYDEAGRYIGLILLVSAGACYAGGLCAARFGASRSLYGGFCSCALGWLLALHTDNSWIFLAALIPAIFALQFCFPVLLGLYGELDQTGRWAAIATPLLTSGFAWAAIAAGVVVQWWSIPALAIVNAGGMAVCGLLLLLALHMH